MSLLCKQRKLLSLLILIALLIVLGFLLVNECFYWAEMGAAYKTCDCVGIERELYDPTAVDGPRKTVCIGIVQSPKCYKYIDGHITECS